MSTGVADARAERIHSIAAAALGVSICVVDADGRVVLHTKECGLAAARPAFEVSLPGGQRALVRAPEAMSHADLLVLRVALEAVARCEELEEELRSMDDGSAQLMEQISMLHDTLPNLSAGATTEEVARAGLFACMAATHVRRAIYVSRDRGGFAQVLAYLERDASGSPVALTYPLPDRIPTDRGLVGTALSSGDRSVWLTVSKQDEDRDDLAPESLAMHEALAVPVTYHDGAELESLGAILLLDTVLDTNGSAARGLGSEDQQLANTVAVMLGAVLGVRRSAEFGKELSMAHEIQAQILPAQAARVRGFDIAGDYRNWGDVGGDYFDYVPLQDGRTLAVVADVSGHNLASGMMMVSARATLRTLASRHSDPALLLTEMGRSMYQDLSRTERFLTAAGVALEPGSGAIEIVNAGHNAPMLYRSKDRSVHAIESDSTVLGFLPDVEYSSVRIQLEPGDCLLLYTDGVTEASNGDEDMFGEDRLRTVLAASAQRGAADVVAMVMAAVHAFRKPGESGDDITLVAIRWPGPSKEERNS